MDRAPGAQRTGPQSRLAYALQGLLTRTHRAIYSGSGGLIGEWFGPMRTLLLTTTGRRSGQARVIPLTYFRDNANLALIASNFGRANPPAWWLNLQAQPEADVRMGRQEMRVRARQANPEEQARIWRQAVHIYRPYEEYQRRTNRTIPVVILEPLSDGINTG